MPSVCFGQKIAMQAPVLETQSNPFRKKPYLHNLEPTAPTGPSLAGAGQETRVIASAHQLMCVNSSKFFLFDDLPSFYAFQQSQGAESWLAGDS